VDSTTNPRQVISAPVLTKWEKEEQNALAMGIVNRATQNARVLAAKINMEEAVIVESLLRNEHQNVRQVHVH
jgi:hypothetical protein